MINLESAKKLLEQQKQLMKALDNSQKTLDAIFSQTIVQTNGKDQNKIVNLQKQVNQILKLAKNGKDVSGALENLKKAYARTDNK